MTCATVVARPLPHDGSGKPRGIDVSRNLTQRRAQALDTVAKDYLLEGASGGCNGSLFSLTKVKGCQVVCNREATQSKAPP
jgi:hypothetical protein